MKWISSQKKEFKSLANAWLISKFIDSVAEIKFVIDKNLDQEMSTGFYLPFDVEGVELSDSKLGSTFQTILFSYRFSNPALEKMNQSLFQKSEVNLKKFLEENQLLTQWEEIADDFSYDEKSIEKAYQLFDEIYQVHCSRIKNQNIQAEPKTNVNKIFGAL